MPNIISRAVLLNHTLVSIFYTGVLLSSFISVTASSASLTVSDNLVLRDVDDKTIEHGFFSEKKTIELSTGEHTLVIKYKDVFEDLNMAEERLVTSDYFVVTFNVGNQQKLRLSTSEINNLAAAERFSRAPVLTLSDEHTQTLKLNLEKLSDYELAKQVSKAVNTLAVTPVDNKTVNSTVSNEQEFTTKVINNVDSVPMLKYWWQKASQREKEQFLDFVSKAKETK